MPSQIWGKREADLKRQEATTSSFETQVQTKCRKPRKVNRLNQIILLLALLSSAGILVECDPSIKAIILKIQSESGNDLIVDDLDEQTLVVHPNKLPRLKELLEKVRLLRNAYDTKVHLT